ncbi:uncharacterized protein LOC126558951 [Anopheles maculipalpis]|uniref:uncharacterized protein LOC126558951 n=1 Tax=Anopheles maculipalpis TaxID=1496333 RepID=UPI0021593736|nr:uncharacterized protein LOC126558951 [Anopheles maculipalpis]
MLLQLNDAVEVSSSIERSQRSSKPSQQTKDSIRADIRNEDINGTVLNRTVPNATTPTGIRSYAHVTVAMAHGNTNSTMSVSAHVPKATTSPTLRASTPTEQPARKVDILIYPTVSPETIVVPILSCIVGFPIFALLVICCLRRRAKIARERDRRRNFDLKANTITLVRFNSHHLSNQRSILLQSGDSLSRGYPSLDLDTVYEEKSDTHCSSQFDSPAAHILLTDSPPDTDNEQC